MRHAHSCRSGGSVASPDPAHAAVALATIGSCVAATGMIVRDPQALNDFLAGVERRALRMAQIALGHEQDALDAVQDAMLRLARGYAQRPPQQWRPLFYRILQNRIRDMQRRRKVLRRVMSLLPWSAAQEQPVEDPIEQVADPSPGVVRQLEGSEALDALHAALRALPARQREAFLLRSLEGLDVATTAQAMGCSEGSVKTHYFRALQTLRARLGELVT